MCADLNLPSCSRYLTSYFRSDLSSFEALPLIPMKSKATPLDDSVSSPGDGGDTPGEEVELCPLGPPNGIVLRHFDGLELEDLEGIMQKLGVVVIGKRHSQNCEICFFSVKMEV